MTKALDLLVWCLEKIETIHQMVVLIAIYTKVESKKSPSPRISDWTLPNKRGERLCFLQGLGESPNPSVLRFHD